MDLAKRFLTLHLQYEALRAYFVEQASGPEVARRFGYSNSSLRQLVRQFRQQPNRQFFLKPPRPEIKANDRVRLRIILFRKGSTGLRSPFPGWEIDDFAYTSDEVSVWCKQLT